MRLSPGTLLAVTLLFASTAACGDKAGDDDTAGAGDTAAPCEGDEGTLTVTIEPTSQWIEVDGARAFVRMPSGDELEGIADADGVVGFTLDAGEYMVRGEGAPGDLSAQSDPVDAVVSACEDTAVAVQIYEVDG
jgi:hypothetical protein